MQQKVVQDWDRMAALYDAFVEQEHSYTHVIEHPAVQYLLPDVSDKRLLDAGCGSGASTFFLETFQPRQLVGVDISPEMVALAEQKKLRSGSAAQFVVGDCESLAQFAGASFDLIFSSCITHYLRLDQFFTQCARVLAPAGTLLLSVVHPVYSAQYPLCRTDGRMPEDADWSVRYLDRSIRSYVQPWVALSDHEPYLVESYHYTFGDYFKALAAAGFSLTAVEEPVPPSWFKALYPSRYEAYVQTPLYALFYCTKRTS